MHIATRFAACLALTAFMLMPAGAIAATEYFVSTRGDDGDDGRSMVSAFATLQHGVDALQPGDTLTIAPGEYFGSVRREGLGSLEADTRIRAEIPGTVILRGDRPAPPLRRLEGYRFVYVADFDTEAHVVNELDTLSIMEAVPGIDEVEFTPGTFYQDLEAGKLYLSASDLASALDHHYSITVSGTHGIYLPHARRVILEGIAVTGFSRAGLQPRPQSTDGATWGIFLQNASHSVVRECYAYFNARGIAVSAATEDSGDNVIERCVAWANSSQYGGSFGGLSLYQPRRDVIRDSLAFRNGHKGINIRVTDDAARRGEPARSYLRRNVSWGNAMDLRIKGAASGHIAERNVAIESMEWFESSHNLFATPRGAGSDRLRSEHTIVPSAETNLDPYREFADPDNFDYRLQPDSRYRGAGPDGDDRGPFPYEPNIYYLAPDGSDSADGLSSATPWRSLERAARDLEPGDTLYLAPGVYRQSVRLAVAGDADQPIAIRGRGSGRVVIQDTVRIDQSRHLEIDRVNFLGGVSVQAGEAITFRNTRFNTDHGVALQASNVQGLRVTHSEFTGFASAAIDLRQCADVFLAGNIFDNACSVAVSTDSAQAIRYSDYNGYRDGEEVWSVGDAVWSAAELEDRFEQHLQVLTPQYRSRDGVAEIINLHDFAVAGPMSNPLGVYIPPRRHADDDTLHLDGPRVHSLTPTTANIEWWSSSPATFTVRWGGTPDVQHSRTLASINPYHPHGTHLDHFNTFSFTDLEPGTTYHVRIERDGEQYGSLRFTTTTQPPDARTLFVAPDGDNANSGLDRDSAWRSVAHAADQARPGDTVLIAGGVYQELVRVRATGTAEAPITFKAAPGEKVTFDGSERMLHSAFNIFNKEHIHIDGLYFQNFGRRWTRGLFYIVRGRHIRITRCFADGRSRGTNPELVVAGGAEDLLIRNCLLNGGWGFVALGSSDNVRIENCVVIRVDITPIGTGRVNDLRVRDTIITDNLERKAFAALVSPAHRPENIAFFLRVPERERSVFGRDGGSIAAYNEQRELDRPNLVANPRFAAMADEARTQQTERFTDNIRGRIDDFPDAFATDPVFIERGLGLRPEDFADFHFH